MKVLKEQDFSYLEKQKRKNGLIFLFTAIIGVFFLWYFWPLSILFWALSFWFAKHWNNWRVGIEGEKKVAGFLKVLSDSYRVFHGIIIDLEQGDIDHLILGPTGIFVLETKNWSGKVKCEGENWYADHGMIFNNPEKVKSPSKQVRKNSVLIKEMLKKENIETDVYPMVFFPHPNVDLEVKNASVHVLEKKEELLSFLTERPQKLSEDQIQTIANEILNLDEEA